MPSKRTGYPKAKMTRMWTKDMNKASIPNELLQCESVLHNSQSTQLIGSPQLSRNTQFLLTASFLTFHKLRNSKSLNHFHFYFIRDHKEF